MNRGIGFFLTALIAVAVLQAAAKAIVALVILAIIWGVVTKPVETFGLLAFCLIAGLVERYPLACLGVAGLMTIAAALRPTR